jgi:hypothetical protein
MTKKTTMTKLSICAIDDAILPTGLTPQFAATAAPSDLTRKYRESLGSSALPIDDSELRRRITEVLRTWTGWLGLRRVMSRYPNLHIFLVGGSVRDVLLNRSQPSKDFDFIMCNDASNEAVQALSEFGNLTLGQFGSARWFPEGSNLYADLIIAKDWRSSLWPCEDILDCLNSFDCSANAIAYNLREGQIVDPQNGRRDISRRQIRAIRFDFPDSPVSSTLPLSQPIIAWFRLFHYACVLNMTIEPVTLQWLIRHRHYLSRKAEFSSYFFEPRLDLLNELGIA